MAESDLRMGVLELLRLQRAGEQELVAALSPVERAARGTPEQWSAKDLIAHITAWRLLTADRLRAALEGFEPRPVRPDDEENADFFAEYSERSWYDVEAAADRSVAELADLLPAFPDADLTDAQRYPWNGGRPLLHSVMGNGVEHPAGHLDEWHRLRGEPEHGLQHHEALVTASRNNRLPDQLLGNAIYNLACAHALAGDADRAIAFLSEALQLHPGLTHLARDDADFAAIRSSPAFQSLVAAPSDAPSDAPSGD